MSMLIKNYFDLGTACQMIIETFFIVKESVKERLIKMLMIFLFHCRNCLLGSTSFQIKKLLQALKIALCLYFMVNI
jgi:hypothetical protein